jgi:hypothetical protein
MAAHQDEEAGSIQYQHDEPSNRRPCFSRKKKIIIAVFNVTIVAVILGVFMSRSKTSVQSQLNAASPYGSEDVSAASAGDEGAYESNSSASKKEVTDFGPITTFNGPLPAFISSRNSNFYRLTCDPNEVLTSLVLVTDGYAHETSWEINRPDGTQLAFGPPTGQKYQRMTSYQGELCLPSGRNVLVMKDSAGDGKCINSCHMPNLLMLQVLN